MKKAEALREIQRMSIEEKMAALSPTDKAYIKGYIERAVLETRKPRQRDPGKKKTEK